MDAASDRGNQPTAIDARTGTVLLAEALDGLSYEDLKPHTERLRKLFGTPLRVVSDDDKALLKAIREVFPRVPLQYCHSHFLRNLGEDLMGEHHRRVAEAAEEAKNLALAAVKRLGCGELELLVEGYL
ncbi:MAG: transposase, partial [Candidatus Freyrarchaeum guaymaensis]